MSVVLALDALIAVLLVVTIGYAVVLNRKLGALRNAKSEMEALVDRFTDSMDKAALVIESLNEESKRSGQALQNTLHNARGMFDDLTFLIEKGDGLAERLDNAIGATRAKAGSGAAPARVQGDRHWTEKVPVEAAPPGGSTPGPGAEAPSEQESALLKALQGMR